MGTSYDEDLSNNEFLKCLQNEYSDIYNKAIYEGCVVTVPRAGSLSAGTISLDDVFGHILIPNEEMPESHFRTLSGRNVKINNRCVSVEYEEGCSFDSNVLFEETYYTQDLFKYKVLCIEYPLEPRSDKCLDSVLELLTLRDCMDLIWAESANKSILESFDDAIREFEGTNFMIENLSIQWLIDTSRSLYMKCLRIIFRDIRLKEQASSNLHILKNIKLAVETYMHHGIYKVLFKEISACSSQEDSQLNKVIRNSKDLQLRDLDIRSELFDLIPKARIELSKISGYSTVLGKQSCLRKMIHTISRDGESLPIDDVLPAIIFIILKSTVSNWYAHLNYIKYFHHSKSHGDTSSDEEFLVTTLEAALEHIKSGVFLCTSSLEGQSDFVSSTVLSDVSDSTLPALFKEVSRGNLPAVKDMIEKTQPSIRYASLPLCHPLCDCENCANIVTDKSLSSIDIVKTADDAGITALHVASMYGKPMIVDYLLTKKAEVTAIDVNGYAAIHYAAMRGHQNALLLLTQSGADVNATDNALNTPLHFCSNNGHEGCVKALIYHSEHACLTLLVNAQNINGDTPLHHAARWGYLSIVQLLVDNQADPGISNRKRLSPFDVSNNYKVWEILSKAKASKSWPPLQKSISYDFLDDKPSKVTESGDIPCSAERLKRVDKLLKAVACGDLNLACFYLGLDPKKPGGRSCHPLCVCGRCGLPKSSGVARNMLNVNECNFDGFTALHMAASYGRLDIAKILVKNGAILDVQTRTKLSTPLILACVNQRVQLTKLLLENNCKVDMQDSKGYTALHYAVEHGNRTLVQLILQSRPNVSVKNSLGRTPLQIAESLVLLSITNMLRLYDS